MKKKKYQKNEQLTHFFNKYLFIHDKFLNEKWVNRRHFFIDEKNLEKLVVAGELLSAYSYYMMIRFFHSQAMVLQLVK